MEFLGFGFALVGFLIAAGVWFRSVHKAEEAAEAQEQLAKQLNRVEHERRRIAAKVDEISGRAQRLEKDLAEAVARRDEKAMATVMWELELERSYRQWSDVIVPSDGTGSSEDVNAGQQLAFAISQEVERLREEVGVSIRYDGGLDLPLEPEVALGALRIAEELLALAAKRADEVAVSVDQSESSSGPPEPVNSPSIEIVLDCSGWDQGEDPVATELALTVERMAHRLEGWVKWQREDDSRVVITVRLPAPAPDLNALSHAGGSHPEP